MNFIDTTACDELLRLIGELRGQGVTLAFARVRDQVREGMRLGGVEAAVGPDQFPRAHNRRRARLASRGRPKMRGPMSPRPTL